MLAPEDTTGMLTPWVWQASKSNGDRVCSSIARRRIAKVKPKR
jgi:hypothetical protein